MTKKDYVLIAGAIKEQWKRTVRAHGKGEYSLQVHWTALEISYALKKENPRFDNNKFLEACGIQDETCTVCKKKMPEAEMIDGLTQKAYCTKCWGEA